MVLFGTPLWIVLIFLFLLGAVLGSFLNVCIYRIPRHEGLRESLGGLWDPPSHCPRCSERIPVSDNIPIIGWLKLAGRCRFCKGRISPRYPLIELFNALLFVVVYWFEIPAGFGASIAESCLYTELGPQGIIGSAWLSPSAVLHWRYAYHMVLLEMLVVASFIDIDLTIIPDGTTLPAMAVGLLGAVAVGRVHIVPLWFQDPHLVGSFRLVLPEVMHPLLDGPPVPEWFARYPHVHGLLVSVAGLLVGGGIVWAVRVMGQWVLRQEAMGFGDVVLMAAIGSFLGWQPTVVVFFVAPVCALLTVVIASLCLRRYREIPYGPYLAAATLIVLLAWQSIWPIAERVFALGPVLILVALIMGVLLLASLQVTQLIKRLLGIPLYPEEWVEEWTSADQLAFFAGERVDHRQGLWPTDEWPGTAAGRGTAQEQLWKEGSAVGWQEDWQRRD